MKKFLCATLILSAMSIPVSTLATTTTTTTTTEPITTNTETTNVVPRAQYGEINQNNVNFRASYGLSGTILRQVHRGQLVTIAYEPTVYADGYRWQKVAIEVNNRYLWGWVATNYLTYF